jgi:hypothetical protein
MLIGECGTAMTTWPTAQHCTSWRPFAPGNPSSGGKRRRTKPRRFANRAATRLRISAVNVGNPPTALGACDRRLAARVGTAQAVTATAHTFAVLCDHARRYGMIYQDPGASYYEAQYRQRVLKGLRRRAKALGDELQETTAVVGVS